MCSNMESTAKKTSVHLSSSPAAIALSGAHHYYGSHHVLNNLDMTVPYGCIYGLLGSSGCGKTTLLRCILGRLQLAEGDISVLGKPPGSKGHQVPGRDVGYMPQITALYNDFTVFETMFFFGFIHGLSIDEIRNRTRLLIELLDLSSAVKRIKNLSGGQQRRVSLALAMLQEPPLLILDEPTVGVDPLLRAKIWQHLTELVQSTNTTVIITTHYIEEARRADMVGMMRDGHLLAEAPPQDLLSTYNMKSLEEVFLHLCEPVKQAAITNGESEQLLKEEKKDNHTTKNTLKRYTSGLTRNVKASCCHCTCSPRYMLRVFRNTIALIWKNLFHMLMNPPILLYRFLVPTFQIILTFYAFGRNLAGIDLAVANNDITEIAGNDFCEVYFTSSFLLKFDSNTFNLKYYNSTDEAVDQVKRGKAWAAINIPSNFSNNILYNSQTSDIKDEQSIIEIYEDSTNLLISFTVRKQIKMAALSTLKEMATICNDTLSSTNYFPSLITFHKPPVYGKLDIAFTDYAIPGLIVSVIFGFSAALSTLQLISERKMGVFDRTWVAGVGDIEVVLSQIAAEFLVIVVQLFLLLPVVVFGLQIYVVHKWQLVLMGSLVLAQGITGVTFGLFIASMCTEESSAFQLIGGLYFPVILLSGTLWPVLGMPKFFRYLSSFLPTTYAVNAMRLITERGWGLDHAEVLNGFMSSLVWIVLFLTLAMLGMKLKR